MTEPRIVSGVGKAIIKKTTKVTPMTTEDMPNSTPEVPNSTLPDGEIPAEDMPKKGEDPKDPNGLVLAE